MADGLVAATTSSELRRLAVEEQQRRPAESCGGSQWRSSSGRRRPGHGGRHGQSRAKRARWRGMIWRTGGRWFKIWAGATSASWRRGDGVDQDTVADLHLAVGRGARPGSPLLHRSATEVLDDMKIVKGG
ncbi:uncharacterized protein LOC119358829 isoform X2 [Triticum dicoccoides]|uniref:uncharacterized protein LOC119358829 isoform X2 n=1 Tax=Triticum dicoccoides TaxID=85692 RepID=UPI00188F57E0|nr:uncharacterized protein LOC119358829 isoform X2 [Triticum dicoccoides]